MQVLVGWGGAGWGGLFDGDYLHRPLAARETKQGDVTVRSDLTPPAGGAWL